MRTAITLNENTAPDFNDDRVSLGESITYIRMAFHSILLGLESGEIYRNQ
jgi:hypothetical protein